MLLPLKPTPQFPDRQAIVERQREDAIEAARQAEEAEAAQRSADEAASVQTAPTRATAFPQSPGLLGRIAFCESTNNPRASNGTHFGLFQFDLGTWNSVGGSGNPMDASLDEQYMRAQLLMNQRGTQPWIASEACWGG